LNLTCLDKDPVRARRCAGSVRGRAGRIFLLRTGVTKGPCGVEGKMRLAEEPNPTAPTDVAMRCTTSSERLFALYVAVKAAGLLNLSNTEGPALRLGVLPAPEGVFASTRGVAELPRFGAPGNCLLGRTRPPIPKPGTGGGAGIPADFLLPPLKGGCFTADRGVDGLRFFALPDPFRMYRFMFSLHG